MNTQKYTETNKLQKFVKRPSRLLESPCSIFNSDQFAGVTGSALCTLHWRNSPWRSL